MARKIKSFFYFLSGIIACILMTFASAPSANALVIRSPKHFIAFTDLQPTTNNLTLTLADSARNFFDYLISLPTNGYPSYISNVILRFPQVRDVSAGDYFTLDLTFYLDSGRPGVSKPTDTGFHNSTTVLPYCPTLNSNFAIMDDCSIDYFVSQTTGEGDSNLAGHTTNTQYTTTYHVNLTGHFVSDNAYLSSIELRGNILGIYGHHNSNGVQDFNISSSGMIIYSVDDTTSDAIKDQTQKQEEQWQKEEEQRKEDEDKANQAGSDSQTSSDDSQKELDLASKGLFDVLTSFVGAITGASPGSCSISGDFGFFNAGNIDLCTGASKITPITNVVGAVMLIGLIIPACVVLLHRFVDLYNEVMN